MTLRKLVRVCRTNPTTIKHRTQLDRYIDYALYCYSCTKTCLLCKTFNPLCSQYHSTKRRTKPTFNLVSQPENMGAEVSLWGAIVIAMGVNSALREEFSQGNKKNN